MIVVYSLLKRQENAGYEIASGKVTIVDINVKRV
jgi:hypothetical protein